MCADTGIIFDKKEPAGAEIIFGYNIKIRLIVISIFLQPVFKTKAISNVRFNPIKS